MFNAHANFLMNSVVINCYEYKISKIRMIRYNNKMSLASTQLATFILFFYNNNSHDQEVIYQCTFTANDIFDS